MQKNKQLCVSSENLNERVMGWEKSVTQDRLSIKKRMSLSRNELKAALVSLGLLAVVFMVSCVLVGNSVESAEKVTSGVLRDSHWLNTNYWKICWMVVGLAIIFEFLDSAAGMGYGTALTPLLLLMGYKSMQIVPVIMIQQACVGLIGAYIHKEYGNVEWRFRCPSESVKLLLIIAGSGGLAVTFSITAIYGVFKLGEIWIKLYVVFLLLLMGITALIGCKKVRAYRPRKMYFFGILAAFNKGVGGGGYGPVVTVGGLLSGVPAKTMVAITAFSEGIVCVISVIVWFFWMKHGVVIDFILLPSMVMGSFLSVIVAPYVTRIFPEVLWRTVVPLYCCVLAGICLWKLVPQLLLILF
jgi:uncharacterized membrane protein YfcA